MIPLARRVAGRIAREMENSRLLKQRGREFLEDPNYRLDLVERGFLNRTQDQIDDTAILERIVRSYNRAKIAQKNAGTPFQVSNEWLPIYNRKLKEVMSNLTAGNLDNLGIIYGNFFRDPCSTGLVGLAGKMKKRYFSGKIKRRDQLLYIYDVLCRYKLWRSLTNNRYDVQSLVSPSIGNPFGFEIDGVFVAHGADYKHYYATEISRLVGNNGHGLVVELGGGYGGMAYYLVRDNPKITYIDFDLPENLALTAYYLMKAFPELSIVLYGEAELDKGILRDNRIFLMPSFEIAKMPSNSAEVVFNSYSLAEMSAEAINEYVIHMTRISREYFMHINHIKNSQVKADDFGIERYGYELLHRKQALWNRGRVLEPDEYEFLYCKAESRKSVGVIPGDHR